MKQNVRRLLGWAIGVIILVLILIHVSHSSEWRSFQWRKLGYLLLHVKLSFLIPALAVSACGYIIRAARWKFFVNPIKKCSLWVLFVGQVFGFASIYLVGRAGEVVRPAYIAKAEKVRFTSQLAVWLVERVYDTVALIILFALGFYFQPAHPQAGRGALIFHEAHKGAIALLILSGVLIALLIIYGTHSEGILQRLSPYLRFIPPRLRARLMHFLRSFASGLQVIHSPWDFSASVISTAALWCLNITVIWLDFRSLGGGLAHLSWWTAVAANVFAGLGLVIQLPGIGGGFQVAMLLALQDIFLVPAEAAASAAILAWINVLAPCLILAIILAIYEGLTPGNLQMIAREEREETVSP